MVSADEYIHILMFPFMGHDHLIPFLALAKQIHHQTGFNVAIANTPLNIQYLRSTLRQEPNPGIRLFELPFTSSDHGLPPNTENTENLMLDLIGKFFSSSVCLRTPFHYALLEIVKQQGRPPVCVISDVFFGWAVDVANSVGTVNVRGHDYDRELIGSRLLRPTGGSWRSLARRGVGWDMKSETFANLVSAILYEKRFGPYFSQPIIAGLGDEDKPFICTMDSNGVKWETKFVAREAVT
ncbi:hypothetical protein F3Y22_tig00109987pilonHSYRG00267 [Hibiscus syriacus]|uniref:Uncharacterized protein n=1 Tax=Hibiscus syriacus TaxID=106335 RepID=A0A6A3BQP5_HIBSY|nr:hypothetical protein F3Y22_tig00109987pilonHSYRG00267 [Hibiscus syriacus]